MYLSEHFQLKEFFVTSAPHANTIPETEKPRIFSNVVRIAMFLELFRGYLNDKIDMPKGKEIGIVISSCYRNDLVNQFVGGKMFSKHLDALAVDFKTTDNWLSTSAELYERYVSFLMTPKCQKWLKYIGLRPNFEYKIDGLHIHIDFTELFK